MAKFLGNVFLKEAVKQKNYIIVYVFDPLFSYKEMNGQTREG